MMPNESSNPKLSILVLANRSAEALQQTLENIGERASQVICVATATAPEQSAVRLSAETLWIESADGEHRARLRNSALLRATGDWILWLESGEMLEEETWTTLLDFLNESADPTCAYWPFIVLPAEQANMAAEQFSEIRLHPRKLALTFSGRVRETLLPAMEALQMQAEGLALLIKRTSHASPAFESRTIAQHEQTIALRALEEEGPQAAYWNALGSCSQRLGEWETSEKQYRQALQLALPRSAAALEAYYGLLTSLDARDADRQQQLRLCVEAIEQFPLDAQLLCAMGGYLQTLGHHELAARSYDVAFQHGRIEPTLPHLSNILELAAASQADVHLQHEDWNEAEKAVLAGLDHFPSSQRLLRQQLQLAVRRNDEPNSLEIASQLDVAEGLRSSVTSAVLGALASSQGQLTLARANLESAWRAGWNDPLCCLWLAETQLVQRDLEGAQVTINAWQQLQPRSAELRRIRQRWRDMSGKEVTAAKMDSPDSIRAIGDAMIEENSAQTATVALADSASFSVTTDDPSQISLTGNDGKSSQKRRVDPPGKTSAAPLAQKLKSAQQNNSWSNS